MWQCMRFATIWRRTKQTSTWNGVASSATQRPGSLLTGRSTALSWATSAITSFAGTGYGSYGSTLDRAIESTTPSPELRWCCSAGRWRLTSTGGRHRPRLCILAGLAREGRGMKDRPHDEAMAELFQQDPVYALEFLNSTL